MMKASSPEKFQLAEKIAFASIVVAIAAAVFSHQAASVGDSIAQLWSHKSMHHPVNPLIIPVSPTQTTQVSPSVPLSTINILGNWICNSNGTKQGGGTIQFNSDGTYTSTMYGILSGNYSFDSSSKSLVLDYAGLFGMHDQYRFTVSQQSNSQLEMKATDANDSFLVKGADLHLSRPG